MNYTATCELSTDRTARKMINQFIKDGLGNPAKLAELGGVESLYFDNFVSASCASMIDFLSLKHHTVRIVVNQNATVPPEALRDIAIQVYKEVYSSNDYYTSAPVPTVFVASNRREY